jgi:hypothetical protein
MNEWNNQHYQREMKVLADVIFNLRLVNQSVGQPYLIKQNYISGPKQQMRCISINNSP